MLNFQNTIEHIIDDIISSEKWHIISAQDCDSPSYFGFSDKYSKVYKFSIHDGGSYDDAYADFYMKEEFKDDVCTKCILKVCFYSDLGNLDRRNYGEVYVDFSDDKEKFDEIVEKLLKMKETSTEVLTNNK